MEKLFYESRPYAYMVFATAALLSAHSKSAVLYFFSVLLIACSGWILHARKENRNSKYPLRNRH